MKKKKIAAKKSKSRVSDRKIIWLSVLLLAIIVEAMFIMQNEKQKSYEALTPTQQVAGVHTR